MSHVDRSYFVTMGTYQMAILVLFNEHDKLTLDEIEEATKLSGKELEKQITTLTENRILLEHSVSLIGIHFPHWNCSFNAEW